jgi:hypothetical protein
MEAAMKITIHGVDHEFRVVPQDAMEPGSLCLLEIDDSLTLGHYYADVDGYNWVVQDDRVIRIDDKEKD